MARPTSEDKSPILQIVIWFLFIVLTLAYLSRTSIKLSKTRWRLSSLSADDYVLTVAIAFALGQSITANSQATAGFGAPLDVEREEQIQKIEKSGYASDLLYIATLCLAKLAAVTFFDTITPVDAHKRFGKILGAIIILWTLCVEIVSAFKCALRRPWQSYHGKCVQFRAWWYFVEISNIILETSLMVFPVYIVTTLQASRTRKGAMAMPFMYRALIIPACIAKLAFLGSFEGDPNIANPGWKVSIITQTIQCLDLTAACALYLKPFLESLHSGFLDGANLQRRGQTQLYAHGSHNSQVRLTDASSQPGNSQISKRNDSIPLKDQTSKTSTRVG